jgi:2-C-methyl-D-erythritol 4-phosphate cytidylyltransferase
VGTVWSIVVAGGAGARFGQMKQFSLVAGRPVLHLAVEACRPVSAGVVLVVPSQLTEADRKVVEASGADRVVPGGASRARSVRCGLAVVPPEADVIVVHDAARPLASAALFDAVLAPVSGGDAAGAVPGLRVHDTIKEVEVEVEGGEHGVARRVTATLDRSRLVAVQTPQAFRAEALRSAHARRPDDEATDDASLVEAMGGTVVVVPGERGNLKITTPEDLQAAERVLAGREG